MSENRIYKLVKSENWDALRVEIPTASKQELNYESYVSVLASEDAFFTSRLYSYQLTNILKYYTVLLPLRCG